MFEKIFIQGKSCTQTSHLSPVLEAEHGVEEGVESGGHVIKYSCKYQHYTFPVNRYVKITRDVEEILVESSEELCRFKVDVAKPLEVERCP